MEREYAPPAGLHPLLQGLLTTAHDRHVDMVDLISGLPEDALDWKPAERAVSLAGLVHHILHVERSMALEASTGDADWEHANGHGLGETAAEQALVALIDATDTEVKRALQGLDEATLLRVTEPDGRTVGSGLVEEFDHGAMHYGHMQMVRLLWEEAHPEYPSTYEHWGH